jgi:hypothetical protein
MVDKFKVSARILQGKSRPALDTLEQELMILIAFFVCQAKHIYFISSNNQYLHSPTRRFWNNVSTRH